MKLLGLVWTITLAWPLLLPAGKLPEASLNLKLKAPIDTWDEAVPLGNGMLGGLL